MGAPVIDYRPDLGILLVGFLEGVTLTNADLQRPGCWPGGDRGARPARRAPLPRSVRHVRASARIPEGGSGQGLSPSRRLPDFCAAFAEIRRVLAATDSTTVPCNNDLLAGNFVDNGERVWLIDYEYSGNNDPYFELGNIWAECGLSEDQLAELVTL